MSVSTLDGTGAVRTMVILRDIFYQRVVETILVEGHSHDRFDEVEGC